MEELQNVVDFRMPGHSRARHTADEAPLVQILTTETLPPVAGHISVAYRGCLVCWGGYYYDENNIAYRNTDYLYIYPFRLYGNGNIWFKVRCTGNVELKPTSGATAGIYNNKLYIFGGCIDDAYHRAVSTPQLITFDLRCGTWMFKYYLQDRRTALPTPRDKATSWITQDKFFIFGGYGTSWHRLDHSMNYLFQADDFHYDENGQCWNNQLLYYDFIYEIWLQVDQGGVKPSPRAACSSVFVSAINKVFLFGGRHDITRLNDLYELDLTHFIWRKIDVDEPSLVGRSWCSFTLIPEQEKILLFGGLSARSEPLADIWELDISEYFHHSTHQISFDFGNEDRILPEPRWSRVPTINHLFPPRLWHSAVLIEAPSPLSINIRSKQVNETCDYCKSHRPNMAEAILFYGGLETSPSGDAPFVKTLLFQRIQPPSLMSIALISLSKVLQPRLSERNKEYMVHRAIQRIIPSSLRDHLKILMMLHKYRKILHTANNSNRNLRRIHQRHLPPVHWIAGGGLNVSVDGDHQQNNDHAGEEENRKTKKQLSEELMQFCAGRHPLNALFNAFDI